MKLLDRINRTGTTVVMATHDADDRRPDAQAGHRAGGRARSSATRPAASTATRAERPTEGDVRARSLRPVRDRHRSPPQPDDDRRGRRHRRDRRSPCSAPALLMRAQVGAMKDYWYDKVEVSIFLCSKTLRRPELRGGAVTQAQRDQLRGRPRGARAAGRSRSSTSRSTRRTRGSRSSSRTRAIVDNVTPGRSCRSRSGSSSRTRRSTTIVASALRRPPGVEDVEDQRQLLDPFFQVLNGLQLGALLIAGDDQLVTAMLLIANTIRVAAFSRRRETGIMRLVGASEPLHPAAVPARGARSAPRSGR